MVCNECGREMDDQKERVIKLRPPEQATLFLCEACAENEPDTHKSYIEKGRESRVYRQKEEESSDD